MNLFLLGILGGMAGGLLGIGAGTIFIPVLVLLMGFEQHLAQGTALFVMIPTSLVGAYNYSRKNNVEFKILHLLLIGVIIGCPLGSILAVKLSTLILKKVFGIFILIIGFKMLMGE